MWYYIDMKKYISASIASIAFPLIGFAQVIFPPIGGGGYFGPLGGNYGGGGGGLGRYSGGGRVGFTNIDQIIDFVRSLIGYGQVILFLVAIVFFLLAAYDFIKGDPGSGSKKLGYAIVGVIIALLAFTIIPVVCSLLHSNAPACGVS